MNNWNPNKTKIVIQFDDIPIKKEFKIKLFDWHKTLSENTESTNPIPIEAEILEFVELPDKRKIYAGTMIWLSIWRGIYSKWESCSKPKDLNTNLPVSITIFKTNKRKWNITEIRQ